MEIGKNIRVIEDKVYWKDSEMSYFLFKRLEQAYAPMTIDGYMVPTMSELYKAALHREELQKAMSVDISL